MYELSSSIGRIKRSLNEVMGRLLPANVQAYTQTLNFVKFREAQLFVKFIRGSPQASCINIGSGEGYHSILLAKRFRLFVNLDADFSRPRDSPSRANGIQSVCASGTHLPFNQGSFDSVICISAIEHFDNQDLAYQEFSRVLRSGGFTTLTTDSLLGAPAEVKRVHMGDYHVKHYCSKSCLTSHVLTHSFQFRRFEYFIIPYFSKKIFDFGVLSHFGVGFSVLFPWAVFADLIANAFTESTMGYFMFAQIVKP